MSHQVTAREAMRGFYKKVAKATRPRMIANGIDPDGRLAKCMVAQNVIRVALEACYTEMMPIDIGMIGETATRAASYALSVAPMEHQEVLVAEVLKHFAETHMLRCAEGFRINSEWQGGDIGPGPVPNFPQE